MVKETEVRFLPAVPIRMAISDWCGGPPGKRFDPKGLGFDSSAIRHSVLWRGRQEMVPARFHKPRTLVRVQPAQPICFHSQWVKISHCHCEGTGSSPVGSAKSCLCSSMVECPVVSRVVEGSIPFTGAKFMVGRCVEPHRHRLGASIGLWER